MAIYNMTGQPIYLFGRTTNDKTTSDNGYLHLLQSSGDINDFIYPCVLESPSSIKFEGLIFNITPSKDMRKYMVDRIKLRRHLRIHSTTSKQHIIVIPKDIYYQIHDTEGFTYPDGELMDENLKGLGVFMNLMK